MVFFNSGAEKSEYFYLLLTKIGWEMSTVFTARDLWTHTDLGMFTGLITSTVPPEDVRFFVLQRVNHTSLSAEQHLQLKDQAIDRLETVMKDDEEAAHLLHHFTKK